MSKNKLIHSEAGLTIIRDSQERDRKPLEKPVAINPGSQSRFGEDPLKIRAHSMPCSAGLYKQGATLATIDTNSQYQTQLRVGWRYVSGAKSCPPFEAEETCRQFHYENGELV